MSEPRATVPRIVLPITSRGLAVTDRLCWVILAAAMATAAALILYLNRGTIFYFDELTWLYQTPGLDTPGEVLEPHEGHLIATTRLAFKAILETVGVEYVAFRLLAAASVLLSAGLFYALAKRRIGALPALAPTLVLLFLGSAWQHVVIPIGFPITFSVAAGLGALLVLERDDRPGDIAASLLLVLSVATYTTGLGFLVGVAVSVLLRPERRRRAWVFLVPLALYAAWWVWSLSSPSSAESETTPSNALLIPNWVADSLASVMAGLSGLGYDFAQRAPDVIDPTWGRILAALAIVALAIQIRRGSVPPSVWAFLGIALTYWALGALASGPNRTPGSVRYIYMGSVAVLLVGVAAMPSIGFSKRLLAILFAAAALCLGANLALLRDAGKTFRDYSAGVQSRLAALELARDRVDPNLDVPDAGLIEAPASAYFAVVDRYGTPAYSPAELGRQSEAVREETDRVQASQLELRLEASRAGPADGSCETVSRRSPGAVIAFELPRGGATLRVRAAVPATLTLGRFGDLPSAELGSLSPGEAATLRIPPDASPRPWLASVSGARSVEVCPQR
ncbi:MAG: hypothetical protein ACRDL1_08380 [Solirubrobacterales bacterium]